MPLSPPDKCSRFPHCVVRDHFYLSKPIVAKKPDFSRFSTNELSTNSLGFAFLGLGKFLWVQVTQLGSNHLTPRRKATLDIRHVRVVPRINYQFILPSRHGGNKVPIKSLIGGDL